MNEPAKRRPGAAFEALVKLMRTLRGPQGCPWDREQDWRSLRRYTLEEAYEVVQAIDDGDPDALAGELGDLLLQVVFLAQIGDEDGRFDIVDVAEGIHDKLVRRHPHVFAEGSASDAQEVVRSWESIKRAERGVASLLDDVPRSLPALERGQKLGKRAAQLGFDWSGADAVLDKVREELGELQEAIDDRSERAVAGSPDDGGQRAVEEELGDLLFALASLARHLGISAEVALNRAGSKFERRFRSLETAVVAGERGRSPAELEAGWEAVKSVERSSASASDGRDGDPDQVEEEQRQRDE